ncbi:peptidase S8/S53 domain-containing protein [Phlyctochytrium arcticum]|nr:peptidase S8/S53 domain-containing protein [Phlyctochytrium arcticum]
MVRLASFFCLALATVASASPILTRRRDGDIIPDQYIVSFKKNSGIVDRNVDSLIDEIVGGINSGNQRRDGVPAASVLNRYNFGTGQLQGFAVKVGVDGVAALKDHPEVQSVEQDTIVALQQWPKWPPSAVDEEEPKPEDKTWSLDILDGKADGTYNYPESAGEGVDVYVIDTGVEIDHPELEGRATWGKDFTGYGDEDSDGHGTHVSGTVAGKTYGVAKKANIIAVRVLGPDGTGENSQIVAGMNWVAEQAKEKGKLVAANMSVGGRRNPIINEAARGIVAANVAFSVAAGNDGGLACNISPASESEAFTVSASDIHNNVPSYADWGSCVDIVAPGTDITSSFKGGEYRTETGTSMASPAVAGAFAVAISSGKFETASEIFDYIIKTSSETILQNVPSDTTHRFLQVV